MENLIGIESTLERYSIECEWERTGELAVAIHPHQVDGLQDQVAFGARHGQPLEFLDRAAIRAELDSPTYLAGVFDRDGVAMLHPAKLAWGLRTACLRLGVHIYEHTPATELQHGGATTEVRTPYGRVTARRVALATNAFRPLLPKLRR